MSWLISLPGTRSERDVAVSLSYSFEQNSFMVRDGGEVVWAPDEMVGFGDLLDREDVIDTPLSEQLFTIVDDIWLTDPHVQEFVGAFASSDDAYQPRAVRNALGFIPAAGLLTVAPCRNSRSFCQQR